MFVKKLAVEDVHNRKVVISLSPLCAIKKLFN